MMELKQILAVNLIFGLIFYSNYLFCQAKLEGISEALIKFRNPTSTTGSSRSSSRQTYTLPLNSAETINITRLNHAPDLTKPDHGLFRLNNDLLKDYQGSFQTDHEESHVDEDSLVVSQRSARKMNFLRGIWNKPKISPLYLVNGTVCRFINSAPICTFLSTTGIFPSNYSARAASSGQFGGFQTPIQVQLPNNWNQQFDNNNQFTNNQQISNNNQQSQNGNQQSFNNNQPNRQPMGRPAAVLDDDSQDIYVESASNSSEANTGRPQQQQPVSQKPTTGLPNNQSVVRPISLVVNRRPLNFLAFRRPLVHYRAANSENRDSSSYQDLQ